MGRAVALLRGINVGGRNAKSGVLIGALSDLGLTGISTFIASGNVLFDLPAPLTERGRVELEERVETSMRAALGFEVVTFVRTAAQMRTTARRPVFPEADPAVSRQVAFCKSALSAPARQALAALSTERDVLLASGRELWWLAHDGVGRSALKPGALDKAAGQPLTVRSLTTVRKLADLLSG